MSFHRGAFVSVLVVLAVAVAFVATSDAAAAGGWDVADYTSISVKATSPVIGTETALRDVLETSFAALDTNHDGKVSIAELQAVYSGVTPTLFAELDVNGDGFITTDEAEDAGCSGCSCSKLGTKQGLGDLFLAGLSLTMLAVFSSRK